MQDAYVSRPITKVCPLVGIKAVEDNEEESQPKRVTRGKSWISKLGLIISMLMLMLFCQVLNASTIIEKMLKYKIEKINKTSGIYLDPMGEVEIVSSSWNLVVFYNMDDYFQMISKGSALVNKMRRVCEKLHCFEDQCNLVLDNTN